MALQASLWYNRGTFKYCCPRDAANIRGREPYLKGDMTVDSLRPNSNESKLCARCGTPMKTYGLARQTRCPACFNAYRKRLRDQGYRFSSRDQRRANNYQKNYGITLSRYNEMFERQGGRCAACHRLETKVDPRTKVLRYLSVDHDHETGEVRGLLCAECNSALGLLGESQSRARGLISYIKRVKQKAIESEDIQQLRLF